MGAKPALSHAARNLVVGVQPDTEYTDSHLHLRAGRLALFHFWSLRQSPYATRLCCAGGLGKASFHAIILVIVVRDDEGTETLLPGARGGEELQCLKSARLFWLAERAAAWA